MYDAIKSLNKIAKNVVDQTSEESRFAKSIRKSMTRKPQKQSINEIKKWGKAIKGAWVVENQTSPETVLKIVAKSTKKKKSK